MTVQCMYDATRFGRERSVADPRATERHVRSKVKEMLINVPSHGGLARRSSL